MIPYDGKSTFTSSSLPAISELQQAHLAVEDVVLALVHPDPNVKMIAHFDGNLTGHMGQKGAGTGSVRFWQGRYSGSSGVLVEQGGTNLVPNPSAEIDLTGWSLQDSAVTLSRDTSQAYRLNNTSGAASFKLAGSGDAGLGYMKSTVSISSATTYSASVYVFAPAGSSSKARLELSFAGGGTPVSYNSGDVSLTAGGWTRIRLDGNSSNSGNTTCEVRVYLSQQAPSFLGGSRLSTLTPTATAPVTDNAMTLSAGDIVMCATSAAPSAPAYGWHMVTMGATGVTSATLRLDGQSSMPVFVAGTYLSKLSPVSGDNVQVTDNTVTLNVGDLVFCNVGSGYGWHVVTTSGTASSSGLRLDDMPSAPSFASASRLTRILATASAAVTDNAMTINAGDVVYCRTLANPTSSGYRWHMVTTGGTGVNSPNLRLDGGKSAPTFASGSIFSKKSPNASGPDVDMAANLVQGDFALSYTTKNPARGDYGWRMVTTGATGVANAALRLDQASSEVIYVDAIQLEPRYSSSSYIDSYQGAGFGGTLGGSSTRSSSAVMFPTMGLFTNQNGLVAFSMYPLWGGSDNKENVLFDIAYGEEQDRVRLVKNIENNLALSVYDTNGQLKQIVGTSPVSFPRETWTHIAFSWNNGTLAMYLNGSPLSAITIGAGSGQLTNLAASFSLGADFKGNVSAGTVFDDLVVGSSSISADQILKMASDSGPFLGLASARKGLGSGCGNATTDPSVGTETTIAHNLGVTPQFIQITSRSNGVVYLSQPANSTSFFVKGSSSAVNFDWRAVV